MPLIEIDLPRAVFADHHAAMGAAVQTAQFDALGVPMDDTFQIFRPHEGDELKFDPAYNQVDRLGLIVIRITPVRIYSVEQKKALFAGIVEGLEQLGIRREDLLILISENAWEDWYAGRP
jgi:phenylpyruvate tautomerase PptA (4-oxalocrotonate tautomerase family)